MNTFMTSFYLDQNGTLKTAKSEYKKHKPIFSVSVPNKTHLPSETI